MRYCRRIIFICLLLPALTAWSGTIALVLGDNSKPFQQFASSFSEALGESNARLVNLPLESLQGVPAGTDVIVAVGGEALRKVLAQGAAVPIVATLLPRQVYERALADFTSSGRRITAVLLDQPPARQVAFLRHLLPEHKRIGMLWSGETRQLAARFQAVVSQYRGLRLESEEVDADHPWLNTLGTLLSRADVLLANPDSKIYNRANIKPLLITSLRTQKPVVGFSESMVQAGALAALYSTPQQIARQTAGVVNNLGPALPPPASPLQFTLSVNYSVASAFDLKLPEEPHLLKAMLADHEAR